MEELYDRNVRSLIRTLKTLQLRKVGLIQVQPVKELSREYLMDMAMDFYKEERRKY